MKTEAPQQIRFMASPDDGSGGFTLDQLADKIITIGWANPYIRDTGYDYGKQPNLFGAAITALLGDDPHNWKGVLQGNEDDIADLLDELTEDDLDVEGEVPPLLLALQEAQYFLADAKNKSTWGEVASFLSDSRVR